MHSGSALAQGPLCRGRTGPMDDVEEFHCARQSWCVTFCPDPEFCYVDKTGGIPLSAINSFRQSARFLSIGLVVAAAGAVIAALNHISSALGFAAGATTQEEMASALTSELTAQRWGFSALLLFFLAIGLHMWLVRPMRSTQSTEGE